MCGNYLRLTIAGLLLLLFCLPAAAVEPGGTPVVGDRAQLMDEVVVTATRTENKVMETASNIAVIKASDLEKMDAKNLADALKKVPGVYYTNASGLEPKISLRGTHIGMSGGALVLLNGIPVNMGKFGYTDFEALPIENIDRVEIVKGPMSALYGGDSARGVINIITKRGSRPLEGNVSAAGGTHNDQRYSALVYGAKGDLDYNLNLKKREQDGYRDRTSIDNYYANGEIGWFVSDATRLSFYFNLVDKERELAKKLTEAQRDENPRQAPDYSESDNNDIITGLNLDVSKELYDIKTTLYYKNRDKDYENYKLATRTPYKEELDEDVYGIRSIFSWKQPVFGRGNTLSVGFDCDYDSIDLDTVRAQKKEPGAPYTRPDPKKSGDFSRTEIGFFIQDELRLLDNLTLTLGLRYDYFEFDNDADYDFSQGGRYDYDEKPDFDEWNPRLSLNYMPLDNLSLYAGYSKAYRAPNLYDYYASGSYSAKNAYTLKPETFTQYEVGTRYGLARWLNVELCYFHLVIDDMLDTAYDESGTYMGKQNISEVTIEGVELTLAGEPCDWFTYRVGYSWMDSEYSDDLLYKVGRRKVVNVKGNSLTKVPDNKVNVDLDFKLLEKTAYRLFWHVNYYYQDEYEMDKANTDRYQDYSLVNSKLRLVHDSFEAFVAVDNIFDEDYDGYAYRSYGKNYYYPAAGTTYAVGLKYVF
ncbi:MAG: TonB-dependent receptor [Deltaproteobacteria bacterium]|nr:TonB-dependent receptor [Deltaproteobacteria bacterium]